MTRIALHDKCLLYSLRFMSWPPPLFFRGDGRPCEQVPCRELHLIVATATTPSLKQGGGFENTPRDPSHSSLPAEDTKHKSLQWPFQGLSPPASG